MATTQSWLEEAATSVLRTDEAFPAYHMYVNAQGVAEETLYFDDSPGEHTYFIIKEDGQRVDVPGVNTILSKAIDKSFALIPWGTKLAVETIRARIFAADGGLVELSTEEWNALLDEAKNKHREKLENAGDIGTAVHNCLEQAIKFAIKETGGYITSAKFAPSLPSGYVQGSDLQLELRTSMASKCFMAALGWCKRHQVEFLHTERKIFSRSHFFAGTTDGIANVTICDDLECCGGVEDANTRVQGLIDWKSSSSLRDTYYLQLSAYQFAAIEELGLPITHRFINRLGKEDGKFETWVGRPSEFADDVDTFLTCLALYNSYEKLKVRRAQEKTAVKAIIKQQKDQAKAKLAEETRLAKQAEKDAKAAIKAEEKAAKEAEKAQAKAAKAKSVAGPVLVPKECHPVHVPWTPTPCEVEMSKRTLAELSAYDQEIKIDAQPSPDEPGEAEPGIAPTVQAVSSARFWTVSSTYTEGRVM